jgi:hypothetical protein
VAARVPGNRITPKNAGCSPVVQNARRLGLPVTHSSIAASVVSGVSR